jgi:hypothetical protein
VASTTNIAESNFRYTQAIDLELSLARLHDVFVHVSRLYPQSSRAQ